MVAPDPSFDCCIRWCVAELCDRARYPKTGHLTELIERNAAVGEASEVVSEVLDSHAQVARFGYRKYSLSWSRREEVINVADFMREKMVEKSAFVRVIEDEMAVRILLGGYEHRTA